ncbi:hypothetical protein J25TS5_42750 [Paenibacillus faecis]|uniref:hypothetical protein n=1 Tax=Paenibacillus faecis TaxID=862114 RepID=UPI001AFFE97E|nr:hypothetical protein [Paenibacillus faecis]GIO87343.1 hypothetical protein J25TS5_42750 [Paenibacillus faecis]
MFENLNERLAEVKEKGRRKEKWEHRLQKLQEELSGLEQAREAAAGRLAGEEEDVARLTGMSLTNLLFTMTGKKAEKLDKEEREVISARLKYEEADRAVRDTREQIAFLEHQLGAVRNWKREYDAISEAKEKIVLENNEPLRESAERQAVLTVELRELEEAIRAGQSVRHDLELAEEDLRSARNWGTYDMLGGGMLSTHLKHSRLDEALEHMYAAQTNLRRFEKELQDVGGSDFASGLEISGVLRFSDYFFDGLIADWLVQGRIHELHDQVNHRLAEVNKTVNGLESARRRVEQELGDVRRKYVQEVENYL